MMMIHIDVRAVDGYSPFTMRAARFRTLLNSSTVSQFQFCLPSPTMSLINDEDSVAWVAGFQCRKRSYFSYFPSGFGI